MSTPDTDNRGRPQHPGPDTGELHRDPTIWLLAAGPTVWAVHFLLMYVTAAVWCAKTSRDAPLGDVRWVLVGYTVVALIAIAHFLRRGWRLHRRGGEALPHDADTAADRRRFMGFSAVLLSGLSIVAVVYATMPVFVIGTCR